MMNSEQYAQLPVGPVSEVKPAGPSGSAVSGLPTDSMAAVL